MNVQDLANMKHRKPNKPSTLVAEDIDNQRMTVSPSIHDEVMTLREMIHEVPEDLNVSDTSFIGEVGLHISLYDIDLSVYY